MRVYQTSDLNIGDKTNKGIVNVIYDQFNLSINYDLYDLRKHKVLLLK